MSRKQAVLGPGREPIKGFEFANELAGYFIETSVSIPYGKAMHILSKLEIMLNGGVIQQGDLRTYKYIVIDAERAADKAKVEDRPLSTIEQVSDHNAINLLEHGQDPYVGAMFQSYNVNRSRFHDYQWQVGMVVPDFGGRTKGAWGLIEGDDKPTEGGIFEIIDILEPGYLYVVEDVTPEEKSTKEVSTDSGVYTNKVYLKQLVIYTRLLDIFRVKMSELLHTLEPDEVAGYDDLSQLVATTEQTYGRMMEVVQPAVVMEQRLDPKAKSTKEQGDYLTSLGRFDHILIPARLDKLRTQM